VLAAAGIPFASARVSLPAGPLLAFTRDDGALAVASEDGTATYRLASPRGAAVTSHSWSPDGRRIAFTRCRGRNCIRGAVYVVGADGTGERLIASHAGAAVWLRDGKHLLLARSDRPGHWIVAVGDGSKRMFRAPGLAAAPFSPRVSADGRRLLHLTGAYGRRIRNPYAPHHARARNWLVVTDLASGRSSRVSNQRGWYMIGNAPWSPDGRRFTFTRRAFLQAPGGSIYVSAPTGTGDHLVARGARSSGAWSPDGGRLAFNSDAACKIRVVSVDGSSPPHTLAFRGCLPTWRP
jgi:Tol biopolymer transport system component